MGFLSLKPLDYHYKLFGSFFCFSKSFLCGFMHNFVMRSVLLF